MPFIPDKSETSSRFIPDESIKEDESNNEWKAPGSEPLSYEEMMKESLSNIVKETSKNGPLGLLMGSGKEAINNLNKLIERGAYKAGGEITDITESPLAGTATATVINALPMAFGGLASKTETKVAPTIKKLKELSNKNYKIAENAGISLRPEKYQSKVSEIENMLNKKGYRERLYPQVKIVLDELKSVIPKNLEDLEISRRVAKKAAMSTDPAEARLGWKIVNKIDDFMENLSGKDISSGNAKEAIPALSEARKLWKKSKKAEIIEGYIEEARNAQSQYSQSGLENALRVKFRKLANNPKILKQFSPNEQKVILSIVRGDSSQNILRLFGKLSPDSVIHAAFSGGMGFALFGPVGSIAIPAAGMASKAMATHMGLNKVKQLDEMVRLGDSIPKIDTLPITSMTTLTGLGLYNDND